MRKIGKLLITNSINIEYVINKLASTGTFIIDNKTNFYDDIVELIIYNKDFPELKTGESIPLYTIAYHQDKNCIPNETWSIKIK